MCPSVKMSAIWRLVSMYLIWILGYNLMLSNNQSRKNSVCSGCTSHCWTSAFDDHFLITASFSSNTYNIALKSRRRLSVRRNLIKIHSLRVSCWVGTLVLFWVCLFDVVSRDRFPRTWSLVLLSWCGKEWNTSMSKSQRSKAGIPSMRVPASRGIIWASVELCETEVCFLHIQLLWTNVWLPKMHNSPPEVDFESACKIRVLKQSLSALLCCISPTWQYCLNSHVWWMFEIKRAKRLSQALVHFVIARASSFTDSKMSGLPIPAKYRHFRKIWEHTFDSSPTDLISSSLNWWSSVHGVAILYNCWVDLLQVPNQEEMLASDSSFFYPASWHPEFKQISVIVHSVFACFAFSLSATQINVVKEWCRSYQINVFHEYFPHRIKILVSFHPIFMSSTYTDKNNPFSRCTNKHSQLETFFQPCLNRIFSNCLFHNSPVAQEERLDLPYWTMM